MPDRSPLNRRRALIVDDEIFFAISLEVDMHELGFDICDLAANGQQAYMLALNNKPDVVLVDINLEGAAKGSTLLGGFARYARRPLFSSLDTWTAPPLSASANYYREPRFCPSRSIMGILPTR